ncbi:MAG: cytochrome c oxidase accessory protein CcoG [Burkholderiales bacterium]|nr:cytochrome c oxidase accessory protein CcoG [Burkholderiales bacterium]
MAKPTAPAQTPEAVDLYEVRKKIYTRAVRGWFAGWRVALVLLTQLVFYGTPWLVWNGREAVLFDLGARKFYIFGWVFWPQDFIFLTALLVISALALFLFTAIAGRLWCGFACPQTVYTEIFMWIERLVEGEHIQRMRLDKGTLNPRKFFLKSLKHAIWIALALWTGFTFVGYFTPIKTLVTEVTRWGLGPWETFWILFYGFATYGNAGWMREQVCKYMCPYSRFQSVMFDSDTLVITYDAYRGEPRGSRSKSVDYKTAGLGDCVDCGICVQVCPTGIDIRQGMQYECIGCAACIDGCNQVMDKMGYTRGLIRYSTENAIERKYPETSIVAHVFRPRIIAYSVVLLVITVAALAALYFRSPLKVDVIRDRATLVREVEDGLLENVYRLQIMNTDERPRRYTITVSGLEGLRVVARQPVEVAGATTEAVAVAVRVDPVNIKPGSHAVVFHVADSDDPRVKADEKSRFYVK